MSRDNGRSALSSTWTVPLLLLIFSCVKNNVDPLSVLVSSFLITIQVQFNSRLRWYVKVIGPLSSVLSPFSPTPDRLHARRRTLAVFVQSPFSMMTSCSQASSRFPYPFFTSLTAEDHKRTPNFYHLDHPESSSCLPQKISVSCFLLLGMRNLLKIQRTWTTVNAVFVSLGRICLIQRPLKAAGMQ